MRELPSEDAVSEPASYAKGHTRTWNDTWRGLYETWNDVIVAFSLRQGLNHSSAQNVCQESMMALLRSQHGQAASYDSRRGSFQSWFWGVIRNRVKAERRRHNREVLVAPVREINDSEPKEARLIISEPAADFAKTEADQQQQAVWVAALQRVRLRVKPENFEIYAALLEQSEPPETLARKYGKTVNNVYAIKHRCDDLLIKEARRINEEQGHLADPNL